MTFHVPLTCPGGTGGSYTRARHIKAVPNPPSSPTLPPFVRPSSTPDAHLDIVFDSILKAKRIAVVCGAGISVEAGIPDFRSPDGLFQSLKRDNPKESLTSGKDLFDASVFKSTEKTALFCRMIASLASLSSQSEPTAFHALLRALDDRGQLLRVYTQNIDALEMKAGLSFGMPEFEERFLRGARRVGKAKAKGKGNGKATATQGEKETGTAENVILTAATAGVKKVKTKNKGRKDVGSSLYSYSPRKGKKKTLLFSDFDGAGSSPSLPEAAYPQRNTIPRCIPLHGTLLSLHCQHCTQTFPLDPPPPHFTQSHTPPRSASSSPDPSRTPPMSQGQNQNSSSSSPYMLHTLLSQGTPPPCPSCASLEQTRALVGKRLRGIGRLRPSVVLYGEEHREGECVGEAVRRDLCGIEVETVEEKAAHKDTSFPATTNGMTETTPLPEEDDDKPTNSLLLPSISTSPSKSKLQKKTRSRTTGKGPDLLLVVGTSLRVPGTKRIVREFSKAVRSTSGGATTTIASATPSTTTSPSPTLGTTDLPMPTPPCEAWPDSPTKSSTSTRNANSTSKFEVKTIYLNKEFPSPAREWEDVFDIWVQGDAQVFARAVAALIAASAEEVAATEESSEEIEEEREEQEQEQEQVKRKRGEDLVPHTPKKKKKRKDESESEGRTAITTAGKVFPLTPPATAHRPKLKSRYGCGAGATTVAHLGSVTAPVLAPLPWSLDSDYREEEQDDQEDNLTIDADVEEMDLGMGMVDSHGFQLRPLTHDKHGRCCLICE